MDVTPVTCEICDVTFTMRSKGIGSCPGCRTAYAYKEAVVLILDDVQKELLNKYYEDCYDE